ncbi:MAG TPA: aminotransferase class V-fold PLP-dependent enzyme [Kineosporiaceae bacterium]|nr:aminotransferase class V-fold PLP-dependent enzyme [Kineosporiaceae bacterium]
MLDVSCNDVKKLIDPHPYSGSVETHRQLPAQGLDPEDVLAELKWMAETEDLPAMTGRVSGSVYHGGHEHYALLNNAFGFFSHANALQRDMYPSATRFEAEIIAMTRSLLGADDDVCGALTSGGTESLTTQMLVYRDVAREDRGVTEPEMIIPVTAHCALDKAAHYLGVRLLKAPVDSGFQVDVDWVADHITDRTIALLGSAGNYQYGVVDPIEELGALALRHGIGLHVDACLGGYILPWAERLGRTVSPFDFRVPGVTSLSADPHKYGYGLKGTGVLLYRNQELRRRQYFTATDWSGGMYLSPGMAGSRSVGLLASTWAAMVILGQPGYRAGAERIFAAADQIRTAVRGIPGLTLLGESPFIVAFTTDPEGDIYDVGDRLSARGWRLNGLQNPAGLHFCITLANADPAVAEEFAGDLRSCVEAASGSPAGQTQTGMLYGLSAAGPAGRASADRILRTALDIFHDTP